MLTCCANRSRAVWLPVEHGGENEKKTLDELVHQSQSHQLDMCRTSSKKQMANKYFETSFPLIFWMEPHRQIREPVPATSAFQKRCQIYYKGELEQNSSLAMHHGHYANTIREHIS